MMTIFYAVKAFGKSKFPSAKSPGETRGSRNTRQHNKVPIYSKPTGNINPNREKFKTFPLKLIAR